MDVRLSTEQQVLRESTARVVDRLGPHAVAELDDASRAARLRSAADESGWLDLRAGGARDAPTASGVEVVIVAEELGRGLADAAFMGPTLAAELRRRAGATSASASETVVLDPALSSLSVAHGGVPRGVAVDAAQASAALVLVLDGSSDGYRLGQVALGPGATQLDLTRRTAVPDEGVTISMVEAAGELGDDDLLAWLSLGLAMTCADLVGVMRGAIELARDYAVSRRQYGMPIGSFQAVQHLLADAYVAMEGSRSVTLHAAWAVDVLAGPEALAAAALAKAYCARAARTVCETSIQVHGGIGNTWDCLAHVFLRRALLSTELFGGSDVNIQRVLSYHGIGAPVGSGHGLS